MMSEIFCKGFDARGWPKRPWLGTTGPATVSNRPFIIVQLTHTCVHLPVSVRFCFHLLFSLISSSFQAPLIVRALPFLIHRTYRIALGPYDQRVRRVTDVCPFPNAVEEFDRLKTGFLSWKLEDHPTRPFAQLIGPGHELVQNQEHFHHVHPPCCKGVLTRGRVC